MVSFAMPSLALAQPGDEPLPVDQPLGELAIASPDEPPVEPPADGAPGTNSEGQDAIAAAGPQPQPPSQPVAEAEAEAAPPPPPPADDKKKAKGFRLGRARLHPLGDVDTHVVFNPSRRAPDATEADLGKFPAGTSAVISDMYFALHGGGELEVPGENNELKLELSGEGRVYTGIWRASTRNLSNFSGRLKADSLLNKTGAFTIRANDEISRGADPGTQSDNQPLAHISNDAGVSIEAKPGGGALVFTVGYNFFIDYYERTQQNQTTAPEQDNLRHSPRFKVLWKFFPKTAVFLESDLAITNFYSSPGNSGNYNVILNAQLGANGSITPRLSAVLKVGYANTFSSVGSFESVVGLAEASYAFNEKMKLSLGFDRSVQPTTVFQWIASSHGYARYGHLVADVVQVDLDIGFSYLQYGLDRPTSAPREDFRLVGNVGVAYMILDWLSVGVFDHIEFNGSNYRYPAPPDISPPQICQTTPGNPALSGCVYRGERAEYFTNDFWIRIAAKY
jgi:hypothetical protein